MLGIEELVQRLTDAKQSCVYKLWNSLPPVSQRFNPNQQPSTTQPLAHPAPPQLSGVGESIDTGTLGVQNLVVVFHVENMVCACELPVWVRSVLTSGSHCCWFPDLLLSCRGGQGAACCAFFSRGNEQRWIWSFQKGSFCLFLCFLQARLNCKHCGKPVIDVRIGMQYFSEYSNVQQCPHCGNLDYHFVKPFSSFKVLEAYWRKLCFSNSYFMGISTLLHIFL